MSTREPFGPGDKVKVEWDFGGTDLEDLPYKEALRKSRLPEKVKIPKWLVDEYFEEDEDDELISDWLSDEYGFTHHGWSKRGSIPELISEMRDALEALEAGDYVQDSIATISLISQALEEGKD